MKIGNKISVTNFIAFSTNFGSFFSLVTVKKQPLTAMSITVHLPTVHHAAHNIAC